MAAVGLFVNCVLFLYLVSSNIRNLPPDWDHFHILLEELIKRVPILENTHLEQLTNGPEAFSPDCRWILGESPEVNALNYC